MSKRIKICCIVAAIVIAALLISVAARWSYNQYWSAHPRIVISRRIGFGGGEDDKNEWIQVSFSERVPMNDSAQEKLFELFGWIAQIDQELFYTEPAPFDVRVSGENENGKVTLRYEGYITTEDGETVEYFREKTFDIDLISEEDFFNNPPLSPLSKYE